MVEIKKDKLKDIVSSKKTIKIDGIEQEDFNFSEDLEKTYNIRYMSLKEVKNICEGGFPPFKGDLCIDYEKFVKFAKENEKLNDDVCFIFIEDEEGRYIYSALLS